MAQPLNPVPRLAPGVAVHDVDGDMLAFDGATLSRLTGAAAEVLRLVDGATSERTIARLTRLTPERVREELERLVGAGLVEPGQEAAETGFRRPAHVGVCRDGDQVVLLDLRDGDRHVLSPTATAIWEALLTTGSLPAAVSELEEAFPGATDVADDTERFVATLEQQGLIEHI